MGRRETLLQSHSTQTSNPHLTGKDHLPLSIYPGWPSPCVLSPQLPPGCQCKREFHSLCRNTENPTIQSTGAQTCRCHRKDCAGTAQLWPYSTPLPMEAKGAKTLFLDECDWVLEPQLRVGRPLGQEKAEGLDSIFETGRVHSKTVTGRNIWLGNCSGQCNVSLWLRRQHSGTEYPSLLHAQAKEWLKGWHGPN